RLAAALEPRRTGHPDRRRHQRLEYLLWICRAVIRPKRDARPSCGEFQVRAIFRIASTSAMAHGFTFDVKDGRYHVRRKDGQNGEFAELEVALHFMADMRTEIMEVEERRNGADVARSPGDS